MSCPVSDRTRSRLARSLPLVHQRRDLLVERMEHSFAAAAKRDESFGPPELAATKLVALLLAQVKGLVESAELRRLDEVAAEHRASGIGGRHYSCFGDSLVPILRDLLGPSVPRDVPSAWCDTFWAVITAAQHAEERSLA